MDRATNNYLKLAGGAEWTEVRAELRAGKSLQDIVDRVVQAAHANDEYAIAVERETVLIWIKQLARAEGITLPETPPAKK
jgi:hypothetical protein